jgi:hypothetical protein
MVVLIIFIISSTDVYGFIFCNNEIILGLDCNCLNFFFLSSLDSIFKSFSKFSSLLQHYKKTKLN